MAEEKLSIIDHSKDNIKAKLEIDIIQHQINEDMEIISLCDFVMSQYGTFIEDMEKLTDDEIHQLDLKENSGK